MVVQQEHTAQLVPYLCSLEKQALEDAARRSPRVAHPFVDHLRLFSCHKYRVREQRNQATHEEKKNEETNTQAMRCNKMQYNAI